MRLEVLVPGSIWHVQQPLKFGPLPISTRCTVVRLSTGELWVHSPIEPTPSLVSALAEMGPVRYVVAPNRGHHLYLSRFVEQFPHASAFVAPGTSDKRADLAALPELTPGAPLPWEEDITSYYVAGLPVLNETVFYHAPSQTLIATDLCLCISTPLGLPLRLIAQLLGIYQHLGMSRTMKRMVRDRRAFAASVAPLLELPITRLVIAHDKVIEQDAQALFAQSFAWLE